MHILTKFNDDDRNYVDLPLWLIVALSLLEYWESAHSRLALACHVSLAQLAILESFPVFSILFPQLSPHFANFFLPILQHASPVHHSEHEVVFLFCYLIS